MNLTWADVLDRLTPSELEKNVIIDINGNSYGATIEATPNEEFGTDVVLSVTEL